ncbi:hypothetical protein Bca52824_038330 [Brassica carinata]|uniref:Uncharacterized protein n=1 Tax=Brassica carinata TaxID=52824 RepID=A0A8X7UVW1_BRACI|nr:hypothetical protein Bca52824_038330 [Brassica carinata]
MVKTQAKFLSLISLKHRFLLKNRRRYEVVDPTVSSAEDSARTVVSKVVDPAVTFVEDSARTVIQELMNPTEEFIATQLQRPQA